MIRRLAFAIIRYYPPAWRERYEAEVCELIDDTRVRFRDLGELILGLFTERTRELLMSDEHPRRAGLIAGLATIVLGVLFVGAAALVATTVVAVTGPWSDTMSYVSLGAVGILLPAALVLVFRGSTRRHPSRPFIVPPDVAVRVLPLLFVGMFFYAATMAQDEPSSSSSWIAAYSNWFYFAVFAGSQIASFFPGRELLEALMKVSVAESQVRSSEQWAAGCREWIAKGVPSPLGEAEAQVAHWTRERDAAKEQLHALGYRARFLT